MNYVGMNSMGRLNVWEYFAQFYKFSPAYIGLGLGSVQQLLDVLNNAYFARIHNDILMYYIELGFVGFAIFIYMHFYSL